MKPETLFPNHNAIELPFCLHAIGASQRQCRRLREEGNVNTQIIYGVQGEGRLIADGCSYDIHPGTCFFLPARVPHDYYPVSEEEEWLTNWLCFDGLCLKDTLEALNMEHICVVNLPDMTRFDAFFKSIFNELRANSSTGQLRVSPIIYRVLTELCMIKREQLEQQEQRTSKLTPVMNYIEAHLSSLITLEELASLLNLTPQHFCRVFKDGTGERPFQYILKRRIQKSKHLLLNTESRISEVGKCVGIENSSYFCYNFKKLEGITPTEFREMYASK